MQESEYEVQRQRADLKRLKIVISGVNSESSGVFVSAARIGFKSTYAAHANYDDSY